MACTPQSTSRPIIIKRILRHYGYPSDKQARPMELVLEWEDALCGEWAAV